MEQNIYSDTEPALTNKKLLDDANVEPEIVTPYDIGLKDCSSEFFICPKCGSKAIALDPSFDKNNLAIAVEASNSEGEPERYRAIRKKVLICTNCDHRDLAGSFLNNSARSIRIFDESSDINKWPIQPLVKPYKPAITSLYTSPNKIKKRKYTSWYKDGNGQYEKRYP